jgi:hypothetical protein
LRRGLISKPFNTISLADGDELAFRALMDMGSGKRPAGIDTGRMSAGDAAQYLWARFVWRLPKLEGEPPTRICRLAHQIVD